MKKKIFLFLLLFVFTTSFGQTGKHRTSGIVISCAVNSIPTSNLKLWLSADCYNASDPQPTDGSTLGTWHDRSGSGNDAPPAAANIIYRTAQINGRPAADQHTNGAQGWTLTSDIAATSGITIFAVVKNSTTTSGGSGTNDMHAILSRGADNSNALVFWSCFIGKLQGAQAHTITFGSEDTTIGAGTAACGTSWHILNIVFNTNAATFKLDRATDTTTNANSATIATAINRLGSNNGSDKFDGLFAEIIYYNALLSGADTTTVENYLNAKYGL